MKTINSHIEKNEFKNIYLLCGEEAYLKKQCRDNLMKALASEDDTMNVSRFEGKNIDINALIEFGDTLPFFSERRVMLVEESGFFKNQAEALYKHLTEFPDTTYIIFVESEIDKRSKVYKLVKDIGYVAELTTPDEKVLFSWVGSLCKKEGKQITEADCRYFLEQTGNDMNTISLELEKLFCYTIDKPVIEAADIDAVCVNQITGKIFDMMDAIGHKNQEKALTLYHDLLEIREPAMRILYLITRQFHILLHVKELLNQGTEYKVIASKAGVPPFTVKKYIEQTKLYDSHELKKNLEQCQDTDEGIKTGALQDVIGVELLLVASSSK